MGSAKLFGLLYKHSVSLRKSLFYLLSAMTGNNNFFAIRYSVGAGNHMIK